VTYPIAQHLTFPFAVSRDGSMQTVPQDSIGDVAQSVKVIMSTVQGTRLLSPEFGIPDPEFTGIDSATVSHAVVQWEPRATGVAVTSTLREDGVAIITATLPAGGK
jgi:phage baseplate assembly protein W